MSSLLFEVDQATIALHELATSRFATEAIFEAAAETFNVILDNRS